MAALVLSPAAAEEVVTMAMVVLGARVAEVAKVAVVAVGKVATAEARVVRAAQAGRVAAQAGVAACTVMFLHCHPPPRCSRRVGRLRWSTLPQ